MKKYILFLLLCIPVTFPAFAQSTGQILIKPANDVIEACQNDTRTIMHWIQGSTLLLRNQNPDINLRLLHVTKAKRSNAFDNLFVFEVSPISKTAIIMTWLKAQEDFCLCAGGPYGPHCLRSK